MKLNYTLVLSLALCLFLKSQISLAQFDPAILNQSTVKILVKHKGKIVSVATGFVWQKNNTIVTSLHVMYDQPGAIIIVEFNKRKRKASIKSMVAGADLVLLEVKKPIAGWVAIKEYNKTKPKYKAQVSALGFNRGSLGMSTRELVKGYVSPEILKVLLPPDALAKLKNSNVLDLNLSIYYLDGSLLPGYSGSPIVDQHGSLIGIGDGGLENGAAGVSWVIPASHLDKLTLAQNTRLPKGLGLTHAAFSGDVAVPKKRAPHSLSGISLGAVYKIFNNGIDSPFNSKGVGQFIGGAKSSSFFKLPAFLTIVNSFDQILSSALPNHSNYSQARLSRWMASGISALLAPNGQKPIIRYSLVNSPTSGSPQIKGKNEELSYPALNPYDEVIYDNFTFIKTKTRRYSEMLASANDSNGLKKVFEIYNHFFHGYRVAYEDYLFDIYEDGKMGLNIVVPANIKLKVTDDNYLLLNGGMFCRTCPYEIQYHARKLTLEHQTDIKKGPKIFLNNAANDHWHELNDEGDYGEYEDFREITEYGNQRYVLRAAFSDRNAYYQDQFELNYFNAATNSQTWFQVQGILNRFDHDFLTQLDEYRGTDCRQNHLSKPVSVVCEDIMDMLRVLMAVHLTSFSNEIMLSHR
jgi:hypothetical protein